MVISIKLMKNTDYTVLSCDPIPQNFSDEVAIFADLRAYATMLSAKAYKHLNNVSRLYTDAGALPDIMPNPSM